LIIARRTSFPELHNTKDDSVPLMTEMPAATQLISCTPCKPTSCTIEQNENE